MSEQDEHTVGLIEKYQVQRNNDPDGKHDDCRYFVLDPKHDPIARRALFTYATEAAGEGYEALSADLLNWIAALAVDRSSS